jgi:hypothetical protein
MPSIIRLRRGSTYTWANSTVILAVAELGLDTTLNKIKVGNGTQTWNNLPFINVLPSEIVELSQDAVNDAIVAGTKISKTYDDILNTITINSTLTDVDNTSDMDKPISDDTQAALNLKSNLESPTFTGTVLGITKSMVGLGNVNNTSDSDKPVSALTQIELDNKIDSALVATTYATLQSATLTGIPEAPTASTSTNTTQIATTAFVKAAVSDLVNSAPESLNTLKELSDALGSDQNYAVTISNALSLKAPLSNPTFTGQVSGITKNMIDLGNVDNTTDVDKPISNATQTAINLKLLISEPSVDYYIKNSGTGSYLVNGVSNAAITFLKGKKYRIFISASGHPFWIQTSPGAYNMSNIYNQGIENAGAQDGSIIIELPQDAPDNLYYACQYHSSMVGSIIVKSLEDSVSIISKSLSYTLLNNDSDRMIEMSGGGSLIILDSTSFPIGFTCNILQTGPSQVTIAGSGFTVNSTPGLKLRNQWSSATLVKRGLNSWVAMGDLTA